MTPATRCLPLCLTTRNRAGVTQKRGGSVVRGSNYPSFEVDRGLAALALCDGSARRAERLLRDQGGPIAQTTLRRWKDDPYASRYLDVKRSLPPRLNALQAEQYDAMATKANSLNAKILDRLADVYEELSARDLPGASSQRRDSRRHRHR